MSSRWEPHTLGELAEIIGGGTPSRGERSYFGGSIPWVTPTDLRPIGEVRSLGQTAETITDSGLRNSSARLVPSGSVLFSSRASIGKIAVTDRVCATNQGFANFIPKQGVVDAWFLAFLLSAHVEDISRLAGETTFKEVSKSKLREFAVRVPSDLAEQRRIVTRILELMNRVDEAQRLRTENEFSSTLLLPALLRQQFEGLDTSFAAAALEQVTLESRYGTSEKCDANGSGTPVLRIPNVAGRRCNFEDLKFLPRRVDKEDNLLLRPGDLLIVRTNGSPDLVGRCAVVPALQLAYAYASYLIRFRLDEKRARPKYVSYFLSSTFGRDQIAGLRRTSAGQFNINSESLRSIVIPLPPVEEQDAMVERMDRIDTSVRDLQGRLTTETLKTSLMPAAVLRKAFAGEL